MLVVKVKETNQVVTLSLIDPKTGCDYIADFIGNTGALGREFERLNDEWQIAQDDLDWWLNVIAMQQKSNDLQATFLQTHSYDDLMDIFEQASHQDLDTQLAAEIELLEQAL